MCLSKLYTEAYTGPMRGYKVGHLGKAFTTGDTHVPLPIKQWVEDTNPDLIDSVDIRTLSRSKYPSGYHVLLDLDGAEYYAHPLVERIVEVMFEDVVAWGEQECGNRLLKVVVARRIWILGEVGAE